MKIPARKWEGKLGDTKNIRVKLNIYIFPLVGEVSQHSPPPWIPPVGDLGNIKDLALGRTLEVAYPQEVYILQL